MNVSYASPLSTSKIASAADKSTESDKKSSATSTPSKATQPLVLPELPARNSKLAKSTTSSIVSDTKQTKSAGTRSNDGQKSNGTANKIRNFTKIKSESEQPDKNDADVESGRADASTLMIESTSGIRSPATNDGTDTNTDELLSFTSSNLIERLLGRLRWRREHIKRTNLSGGNAHNNKNTASGGNGTSNGANGNEENLLSKSNKRAVNLLRATGWFGSGKSTNSTTGLMSDSERSHNISGISRGDGGKYASQSITHIFDFKSSSSSCSSSFPPLPILHF